MHFIRPRCDLTIFTNIWRYFVKWLHIAILISPSFPLFRASKVCICSILKHIKNHKCIYLSIPIFTGIHHMSHKEINL